jgi:hypothetical protein
MISDLDLDLVRRFYEDDEAPTPAALGALRLGLVGEMTAADRTRGWAALRGFRQRWTGWRSLAAAVAVALLVGLVLAGVLRGGVAKPDRAAAAVLQRAARYAEAAGGPGVMRAGQYWYVEARFAGLIGSPIGGGPQYVASVAYEVQLWEAPNGSGRAITRMISTSFPSASDRDRWEQAGRPALMTDSAQQIRPTPRWIPVGHGLTYTQMVALPTSPATLKDRLEQGWHGSVAWRQAELFTTVGDLLRESPVPGPLRAALYRVAASIPGIRLLGLTKDGAGRPALAIADTSRSDGPPSTSELLFDPKTAQLLGERASAGAPDQTTTSTYLAQGIVNHLGQLP